MLFEHGAGTGDDTEVRAAVLESECGKGLYYASAAVKGRPIAFYDGVVVSEEEYHRLNEETGLSHTLQTKTGRWVNGLNGVTGMQFANTARRGAAKIYQCEVRVQHGCRAGGRGGGAARPPAGADQL